jgi:hypothetical protein
MELLLNQGLLLGCEKHLEMNTQERSKERVDYTNGFLVSN